MCIDIVLVTAGESEIVRCAIVELLILEILNVQSIKMGRSCDGGRGMCGSSFYVIHLHSALYCIHSVCVIYMMHTYILKVQHGSVKYGVHRVTDSRVLKGFPLSFDQI